MFRFFYQYYLFLKWRHLFNDCPQPAFKGNKPILGFPGLVIERSITNQCGHVDVSNPVQQQPLKASLTCGPEDTFLGNHLKSSAVRVSRAPAGMTSKRPSLNFFKAFSWLLTCNLCQIVDIVDHKVLLLTKTYHSVMRILAHVLVDVPACDLHISATLDEFYTPSPFLNAEVNGEGQVQCLHRRTFIIMECF